ncbi:hypothetical protein PQ465_06730 [Sphingobacterium oryzagri]|uniref:SdpI/YhfL protein family protein n=1 Tax=Sphingobacterium oryzagri TaxID=3025669 RepID=A0ABY7WKE1_9SPHI|nr:hypothetical protein [Sphingobacterium sp. KACC 22765]WDF70067.1 hypothetical protein PQ465_06730 [Sphingobacterium sp. KACC 22765]
MERTLAVFIPIALFICVTLCVYFVTRFRYEAITKLGGPIPKSPSTKHSWKRPGIVVVGSGLGLLVTGILLTVGIIQDNDWIGLFIVGTITLFVGVSIIVADKLGDKENEIDG